LLFDDLDHGIAWFDNKDIDAEKQHNDDLEPVPLLSYFQNALTLEHTNPELVNERLLKHMHFDQMNTGTVLLHEGDPVDKVYFIESGEVQIQTIGNRQTPRILRVQSAGTVFGEIGIYNQSTATAAMSGKLQLPVQTHRLYDETLDRWDCLIGKNSLCIHGGLPDRPTTLTAPRCLMTRRVTLIHPCASAP